MVPFFGFFFFFWNKETLQKDQVWETGDEPGFRCIKFEVPVRLPVVIIDAWSTYTLGRGAKASPPSHCQISASDTPPRWG